MSRPRENVTRSASRWPKKKSAFSRCFHASEMSTGDHAFAAVS
jgi:hypothetical protein